MATPETTFTAYNEAKGRAYAQARRDYHPSVYKAILGHHAATGGRQGTAVDVGCGPGNVARSLAPHFQHVLGLDPSEGMLAAAQALSTDTRTAADEPVRFEVGPAEALARLPAGSVDLVAAGNAAHWFDLPQFWRAATHALAPGGSVALWTSGDLRVHPATPNAAAIQAALDDIDREQLQPYYAPGNFVARGRYRDLALPWSVEPRVDDFDETGFWRRDWTADEEFYAHMPAMSMAAMEAGLASASPVVRWREANPELVGTERDVVRVERRTVERLLREAGVKEGEERVRGVSLGSVLMVKKRG